MEETQDVDIAMIINKFSRLFVSHGAKARQDPHKGMVYTLSPRIPGVPIKVHILGDTVDNFIDSFNDLKNMITDAFEKKIYFNKSLSLADMVKFDNATPDEVTMMKERTYASVGKLYTNILITDAFEDNVHVLRMIHKETHLIRTLIKQRLTIFNENESVVRLFKYAIGLLLHPSDTNWGHLSTNVLTNERKPRTPKNMSNRVRSHDIVPHFNNSGFWQNNDKVGVRAVYASSEKGCVVKLEDQTIYKANKNSQEYHVMRKLFTMPHPNIARVLKIKEGADRRGFYHYILENGGEDIHETIRRVIAPRISIVAPQLISAVNHIHNVLGVIHRDLTPYNIVFDGETAKIIDFDLATKIRPPDKTMGIIINPGARQNIHPFFNGYTADSNMFDTYFNGRYPYNWQRILDYYSIFATMLQIVGIKVCYRESYLVFINNPAVLKLVLSNANYRMKNLVDVILYAMSSFELMGYDQKNIIEWWNFLLDNINNLDHINIKDIQ